MLIYAFTSRDTVVSALKCMRETDHVSIREPASCEHLRLSDLNNGWAD